MTGRIVTRVDVTITGVATDPDGGTPVELSTIEP